MGGVRSGGYMYRTVRWRIRVLHSGPPLALIFLPLGRLLHAHAHGHAIMHMPLASLYFQRSSACLSNSSSNTVRLFSGWMARLL